MKGVLELKKENGDRMKTVFHFKKEDVRNFFKVGEGIEIHLYGYGAVVLDYDEELYEKLEMLIDE